MTYSSWAHRKSECKGKAGWTWADEWETYPNFLKSMGPRPSLAHSLDRTNNDLHAYGPGLCKWATKAEQNNNKSDNLKIVHPTTGEVFTTAKLAKMHGVLPKTIYNWKAKYYSDLEMIAGIQNKHLHAVSVYFMDHPALSSTTKAPASIAKLVKRPQLEVPKSPKLCEADMTDEDVAHYTETGVMRYSRFAERQAEYAANVEWFSRWNAGLQCSPQPPQGEYYHLKVPDLPAPKPTSKPTKNVDPAGHDEFDPADDVDPENTPH